MVQLDARQGSVVETMGGGLPSAWGGTEGLAGMAAVLSKTGEVASLGDDAAAMLKMATTAGCGGWSGREGGAGVMHDDDGKQMLERAGGLDEEDESEEVIDIEEKLAPLSREQLKELVASLIARHEKSIGDTVLQLAMRPVDTSHVQHQITSLHVARGTAETFADSLLPIADQAVAYARAGDHQNALALSEALCTNLLPVLPRTDPETALAPLWTRIESAFEFSISKVRKR